MAEIGVRGNGRIEIVDLRMRCSLPETARYRPGRPGKVSGLRLDGCPLDRVRMGEGLLVFGRGRGAVEDCPSSARTFADRNELLRSPVVDAGSRDDRGGDRSVSRTKRWRPKSWRSSKVSIEDTTLKRDQSRTSRT